MNSDTIKILFLGDIVGKPGRYAIRDYLAENKKYFDFVIANVENASHGFGLTEKNYNELSEYGVDCMTSGNHIWDKKDIFDYIENADKLVRPANYPVAPGVGYKIFECNGFKIGVINLLGRIFMPVFDSPISVAEEIIEKIKQETNIIFVDFHAEATAEKMSFARYLSEKGVSIFAGTHTHVQTADERIINNKTAYITDAGYCGDSESIIGMDYESSLKHLLTMLPCRFEVADTGSSCVNGISVLVDVKSGDALSIERINLVRNTENQECEVC